MIHNMHTCTNVPKPAVFFPAKIEGVGKAYLGRASIHIKGFGSTPIPLQREIGTEGIGGPSLRYAGENTGLYMYIPVHVYISTRCSSPPQGTLRRTGVSSRNVSKGKLLP